MTGVPHADLKVYFAQARSWEQDRLLSAHRSKRLAWIVAAAASTLSALAVGALAALTPLKTVAPYVIRVDRATGAVDVMTGLTGKRDMTYEEAVTKSALSTYVRARESWLAPAGKANFRQVAIMSTPDEQQRWAALAAPTNPSSAQILYGPSGRVDVDIRAISFVADKVANVRFHRILYQGPQVAESDWIATLSFAYTAAPMLEADRLLNPLGFQVVTYRADPEVAG
jgi:type IV secretion system protein VirB8